MSDCGTVVGTSSVVDVGGSGCVGGVESSVTGGRVAWVGPLAGTRMLVTVRADAAVVGVVCGAVVEVTDARVFAGAVELVDRAVAGDVGPPAGPVPRPVRASSTWDSDKRATSEGATRLATAPTAANAIVVPTTMPRTQTRPRRRTRLTRGFSPKLGARVLKWSARTRQSSSGVRSGPRMAIP